MLTLRQACKVDVQLESASDVCLAEKVAEKIFTILIHLFHIMLSFVSFPIVNIGKCTGWIRVSVV